jgi:large subunit ribosomal protein L27e
MVKFIKIGRLCVLLNGRFAGKKCFIVKCFDEGSKSRPYAHALVAGVEQTFKRLSKKHTPRQIQKRTTLKTFVKYINYKHLMPTRYVLPVEVDPRKVVTDAQMDSSEGRKSACKALSVMLKEKFIYPPLDKNGQPNRDVMFLRNKLRF